ncbi:hypothetical protein ACS0TY_035714 [Phlomoides rotata]
MTYTSHILDQVKTLGFQQATATSISLGIDDLLIIPSKRWLVQDAEQQSFILEKHHHYGNVHAVEKLRQSIEIWYATSEYLRQEMNPNFRMTEPINPVHIMSFSGARGNASQVHQLVGMRGLMSYPQGQMIDLPIQSNLREGLSLSEYIISCYGARKGVVDTVVRTSDAGYLTRRLVEVVQHIVVRRIDCGTARGISVSPQNGMMPERIFIQTLIGRVLADDIYMGTRCIATRNQDIGIGLVNRFITFRAQPIAIRTPFTCRSASWICRLCYGRSPTHGDLVELGEAVESEQVIAKIHAVTSTLNFKEKIRKHIYSDSDGEMHWSTDVYHAPEFTYGSVHLLPKTSHLWILLGEPRGSSLVSLSIHKDQDQMSARSRSVKSFNLSGMDDQLREKFFTSDFSGKKEDRIPDYSDLSRIIYTGRCNLVDLTLLYQNSDLFSKRRRNRFIIPLQSIQERENGLTPPSDILIEIPINGIFRRNIILAYLDDPRYRRKSSGITKYGTLEMHSIERDNVKLRVVNYILYGNVIRSAKTYLATPGATVHGHYGKILYEGDTLITFIYEKSRSGDITQGLLKVEQVLEVCSIDSISMNLDKRIEGWNERITRILGMPWAFLIGVELTIVQSPTIAVRNPQTIPTGGQNFFEYVLEFIRDVRALLPWKIIELPHGELAAPTNDINTTVALALLTSAAYFYAGLTKKGLSYFGKYIQPTPILLPINILEDFTKPLSLSFRLFGNILADELVVVVLVSLVPSADKAAIKAMLVNRVGRIAYLVTRCYGGSHSSIRFDSCSYYGAMTSFLAATTGILQNDLKRVIAYSTYSQLGYMIFACGISNYSVNVFHLMNHAFFKALLFLSAGSVIHAMSDEQDMQKMEGLASSFPFTYAMMLMGSLSLVGFPFLTGFYSKDVILELAYTKYTISGNFAFWLGSVSVLFTSYYSFRSLFLTFLVPTNSFGRDILRCHDAPIPMAIPLILLALGSLFVGYFAKV